MGATKELKHAETPYLVVDIGGGSTEFVLGETEVKYAKSVNIGCVRMSERHLKVQPPKPLDVQNAITDIDTAIYEASHIVPLKEAKTLIAVAGTATTVAAAALELNEYDRHAIHLSRIPASKVFEVAQRFQLMSRDEIAALPYMHPGRVDVIAAGSLVLSRVMLATGAQEFVASESDILDGIAWSLSQSAN
jgi:exopolyphosphatase/guanosine-5'-triphosphate,3'-diphosphate pyrophosphatase